MLNASEISPKTAYIFLQEWAVVDYEKIPQLFNGLVYTQLPRVSYYSHDQNYLTKYV